MKKEVKKDIRWEVDQRIESYSNIIFENLLVKNSKLKEITFENVDFKNCHLGIDSDYEECKFLNCKFYGKYSGLGGFATYTDCVFRNCKFQGIDLFGGQHFDNCLFTGTMKNHILYDNVSQTSRIETVFKNCDLSVVIFNNVNIYGREIFQGSKLPKRGIVLLDNSEDKLIKNAEEICKTIKSTNKIESEVIFKRGMREGQNPIILDNKFLETFFKTKESKEIFESIITGFELTQKQVN